MNSSEGSDHEYKFSQTEGLDFGSSHLPEEKGKDDETLEEEAACISVERLHIPHSLTRHLAKNMSAIAVTFMQNLSDSNRLFFSLFFLLKCPLYYILCCNL